MKALHNLQIFDPLVMMEHYGPVQKAIRDMIRKILLDKVTDKQKTMLEIANYHYWDPNHRDDGESQGLLEHLVFDALGATSTIRGQNHFYSEMFLYNLDKFTGISELEVFKQIIQDIDKRWDGLASIKVISITRGSPTISFCLI